MEATTERRKLGMHSNLLMDTITRQAGTPDKAILEGTMNSIEAGSHDVRINFVIVDEVAHISIYDTGIGIETKADMEAHFETFGTPHEEHENTTWKQFRMGRGQMFAFGKNVWRTATFRMTVDIQKEGLSYVLEENLPFVQGCQIDIEFYKNPIGYTYNSIDSFAEIIKNQVKFMEVPVFFNDEQLNTPASKCTWDEEDDDAYYLFNIGMDFKVYNLGAFVMNANMSEMGMGGIIVSKKQVKVNFARNDVQHDCEVYNRAKAIVKNNRITKTRKANVQLSPHERQATLKELRDGIQHYDDVKSLGLIKTAQGKHISLDTIRKHSQQWAFSPLGDRFADKLMEQGKALCICDSVLSDLGYTGDEKQFFLWLTRQSGGGSYRGGLTPWGRFTALYADFESLKDGISNTYEQISDKKYRVTERRLLKILQGYNCWDGRVLLLGYSEHASGWTDGKSYICIERNWLKGLYLNGSRDITKIIMLLTHEMAHDEDTRGSHIHGNDFYENQVRILEGHNNPMVFACEFQAKIKNEQIVERQRKEEAKIQKEQDKLNKKLGLNKAVA